MVPNALLFITTQTTPTFRSRAVYRTAGLAPKPPSPTSDTTTRSGHAIFAPSAAGAPKPMVANPPGVNTEPAVRTGICWAMPFLFQPTSVVMIASLGSNSRTSARIRSGRIGQASLVTPARFAATNASRFRLISASTSDRSTPPGASRLAASTSAASAGFRSATAPISSG